MKNTEQLGEFLKHFENGTLNLERTKEEILLLFCPDNQWFYVNEKEPPKDIEILAEDPSGTTHLTNWRHCYGIFACQEKHEYSGDWKWKYI